MNRCLQTTWGKCRCGFWNHTGISQMVTNDPKHGRSWNATTTAVYHLTYSSFPETVYWHLFVCFLLGKWVNNKQNQSTTSQECFVDNCLYIVNANALRHMKYFQIYKGYWNGQLGCIEYPIITYRSLILNSDLPVPLRGIGACSYPYEGRSPVYRLPWYNRIIFVVFFVVFL